MFQINQREDKSIKDNKEAINKFKLNKQLLLVQMEKEANKKVVQMNQSLIDSIDRSIEACVKQLAEK